MTTDPTLTPAEAEPKLTKMTFHYIYQVKESDSGDRLDVNRRT